MKYQGRVSLDYRQENGITTHKAVLNDGKHNHSFLAREMPSKNAWTVIGPSGHGYVIQKPFTPNDFRSEIKTWINTYFSKNANVEVN